MMGQIKLPSVWNFISSKTRTVVSNKFGYSDSAQLNIENGTLPTDLRPTESQLCNNNSNYFTSGKDKYENRIEFFQVSTWK